MAQNWNTGSFYGNGGGANTGSYGGGNNNFNGGGNANMNNGGGNNYGYGSYNGFDPMMNMMMNGSMLNMMNMGSMMNMNMAPPPNPMQQQQQNNGNNNNINNNNNNQQQQNNNGGGNFSLFMAPPPDANGGGGGGNTMQPPPNPLQQMQQQGSFYGNNGAMGNGMGNGFGMNPLQQMQQGSFYGNNGAMGNGMGNGYNNNMNMGNNMGNNAGFPPPPPQQNGTGNKLGVNGMNGMNGMNGQNHNQGANYQYDQALQPMKKKKKKKKKKKSKKNGMLGNSLSPNNNDGDYSLSAPKPRKPGRQQKIGRIRNSFLMTSSQQKGGGFGLLGTNRNGMGLLKEVGFKDGSGSGPISKHNKGQQSNRDINALYAEKRKKKITYSRKETDKMKSKLLSSDKNMKKLRDIKDIKQQNKLIMKKIHLCKYVCDFRAAGDSDGVIILDHKEKKRIDNKYELLQELYEHLHRNSWNDTMGDDLRKFLESLFKMISHNLFRVLPDSSIKEVVKTDTSGKDAKITINKELPSWKHLDLIYKIFESVLKKMKDNAQQKNIIIEFLENFNVISNIIYLLNTEEVREEESVANIISLLYSEYKPVRLFVLGQLSNVCYSYLYLNNRDLNIGSNLFEKNKNQKEYSKQLAIGVKTVLLIFRECLISAEQEELDGWVELLCQVIIPLHKAPIDEFSLFDDALGKISVTFCEKYFLSFIYIFQGMLRYWPITSSKKEQLFLHRIGPLLDKADEDIWEFKNKSECEFRDVFTHLAHRIVDGIKSYQHCHYATAERIFEMLEDDTLQRFVDIYGGKECWVKLYKGLYDISTKFFWKETIDKCLEFMENCKEEDDIPMQYLDDYEKIERGQLYKHETPFDIEQKKLKQKRLQRKKYWAQLERKYQRKNVAQYQKHVYKNNQPMLRLQNQTSHENHQPSINWNGAAMQELTTSLGSLMGGNASPYGVKGRVSPTPKKKYNIQKKPKPVPPPRNSGKKANSKHKLSSKRLSQKTKKLPTQPIQQQQNGGLPKPAIWDDDDF